MQEVEKPQYEPPSGTVRYVPAQPPTSGLAIASLVLGIVWVYWIGSILAIIFGAIAIKQCNRGERTGKGMAVAGLVLGIVGAVVALIIFVAVLGASS